MHYTHGLYITTFLVIDVVVVVVLLVVVVGVNHCYVRKLLLPYNEKERSYILFNAHYFQARPLLALGTLDACERPIRQKPDKRRGAKKRYY